MLTPRPTRRSVTVVLLVKLIELVAVIVIVVVPVERPLGNPGSRLEDTIRIDIKDICINTRNWVDSAQDKDYWRTLVQPALNLRIS